VTSATSGEGAAWAPDVEFGPLGETTRSSPTTVWLTIGSDAEARYVSLTVDPITGLTRLDYHGAEGPSAGTLPP
jgi:hypothetical protein